ncbi:hypothetical protein P7K49_006291, partial [Saguinus oedipus]
YCSEQNHILRLLMLFLNNQNSTGVKRHLRRCSDLEEPDQTRECQNDPAFFQQQDLFQPQPGTQAEALASLQHLNDQINSQKHFQGKQINKLLPLKIDTIIRKQQMCFRAQYTVQGR